MTLVLVVLGVVCLTVAGAIIHPAAGFAVAGVSLVAAGYVTQYLKAAR